MSTVADLAGNNPVALDPTVRDPRQVSSVEFRGAAQVLALGASAVQSAPFGNRTRFIRITCEGDTFYDIGPIASVDVTDTTRRVYLVQDAVEPVPVRPGEVIEIIQVGSSTGNVTIREDMP